MIRADVKVAECRESDGAAVGAAILAEFGKHVRFRPWPVLRGWSEVLVLEVTRRDQEIRIRAFAVGFLAGLEAEREARRNEQRIAATIDAGALSPVVLHPVDGVPMQRAHAG